MSTKQQEADGMLEVAASFRAQHGMTPDEAISKAGEIEEQREETRGKAYVADAERAELRLELYTVLRRWLGAVREWGLTEENPTTIRDLFSAITKAHELAVSKVGHHDVQTLRKKIGALNDQATSLLLGMTAIEAQLAVLAEKLIADATVVAVTLTSAYLRDAIQARRFDTIILDEASMAPIPALWIAASLAIYNIVAVGDFKQLPPIVLSENDLAKKWLGRDIFEVAGITAGDLLLKPPPPHFIELREQRRMHPDIRRIPNDLIYEGSLYDDTPTVSDERELREWYRFDWGHDSPVLLINTATMNAWVTSVAKGAQSSRLNFLSATVCVDLAEKVIREEILDADGQAKRRVLIICPYNPHAKLLRLLIKHQGLEKWVHAGTVHSFQGSEADVVIFDLVNDEPHWKVGLFTPANDPGTRRLINVALTRAKRRLFVVGDFDYCEQLSRKAFLGGILIPYLRAHFPMVEAAEIIPPGIAARAARAHSMISGGDVEPSFARTVVTQKDFYRALCRDMDTALKSIVIYSPFITPERLGALEPSIKAAVERRVRVYVITKAHEERGKDLQRYCFLERTLADWGASVIHKLRMHEKLVFIDNNILWSGSLNPLSFSDTQEVMERRESVEVVGDYSSTLRLDELLTAFDTGEMTCPVCGREIMAAEGVEEPYYWRCVVDDCFSRSIGQPMPKDGRLMCPNCGGDLEFGEWGDRYAWRCVKNPRHHLRIHRHHLKLPKMAALVPKKSRRAIEKQLGTRFDFTNVTVATQGDLI